MRNLAIWGAASVAVAVASVFGGYGLGRMNASAVEAPPAIAAPTPAPAPAAPPLQSRADIERIVRDYLVKNPEIVIEMQAALEAKQKEQQRLASLDTIKTASADIFNSKADAVIGNPNGKTTVVEFYDYNCGFCKRALPDMQALTKADPDLRFVLKELPILGPDSQAAHVVSQAFHRLAPEKYLDFHLRLLGSQGRATEDTAMLTAVSLGVDEKAMRAEMAKPDLMAALQKNYELADRLAITGTPSYVIGDEVVFGALGQDVLSERIASARSKCETASC